MRNADRSTGRAYLVALQNDAAKEGFQLIAEKTSAVLKTAMNRSSPGVGN